MEAHGSSVWYRENLIVGELGQADDE